MEVRSSQANKFMWSLLDRLASAKKTDYMVEYKEMLRKYGKFIWTLVPKDEADDYLIQWSAHGSGWMAVKVKEMPNGMAIKSYKGTSAYSQEEMSELLNLIQEECEKYGVTV